MTRNKQGVTLDMLTDGSLWASDSEYYSSRLGPIKIHGHNNIYVRINIHGHGYDEVHHKFLLPYLRPLTIDDFNDWPTYIQAHHRDLEQSLLASVE